jgi:hypothetical protein
VISNAITQIQAHRQLTGQSTILPVVELKAIRQRSKIGALNPDLLPLVVDVRIVSSTVPVDRLSTIPGGSVIQSAKLDLRGAEGVGSMPEILSAGRIDNIVGHIQGSKLIQVTSVNSIDRSLKAVAVRGPVSSAVINITPNNLNSIENRSSNGDYIEQVIDAKPRDDVFYPSASIVKGDRVLRLTNIGLIEGTSQIVNDNISAIRVEIGKIGNEQYIRGGVSRLYASDIDVMSDGVTAQPGVFDLPTMLS